jgi:N-acetyl-anhydromuramyl-L-alanine amidase AmpD
MSKADIKEWQITLQGAGFPPGAIDGDFGPATLKASMASIKDQLPSATEPDEIHEIPMEWLPKSTKMRRIIAHWTAGSHQASKTDREHYHFIWNGDGKIVKGDRPVTANESTADNDGYAAHTKNCNSGSIGTSVACMAGAKESPFDPGLYPMTKEQWDRMCRGIAQLCTFYNIPVTDETVLSHAEVEGTLKIDQNGKWDFTRLPWALDVKGAHACGERMRDDVIGYL